ncbi:MAG: hypothetical protein WD069_10720 [Planctomycetales bacterium]
MARCDEGYLCDVCGKEVPGIRDSDLYLRYVIGEVDARELATAPERHVRCNPVQAQFIVDDRFQPVTVEGPFDKRELAPHDVRRREELVTRGWRRLQELSGAGLSIEEYPLEEVRVRSRTHSAS